MQDVILNPDEVAACGLIVNTLTLLTRNHDKLCPCQLCDARFWSYVTPDCEGNMRIQDVVPKGGSLDGVFDSLRRKRASAR